MDVGDIASGPGIPAQLSNSSQKGMAHCSRRCMHQKLVPGAYINIETPQDVVTLTCRIEACSETSPSHLEGSLALAACPQQSDARSGLAFNETLSKHMSIRRRSTSAQDVLQGSVCVGVCAFCNKRCSDCLLQKRNCVWVVCVMECWCIGCGCGCWCCFVCGFGCGCGCGVCCCEIQGVHALTTIKETAGAEASPSRLPQQQTC
jgi:hypothetical protein